MKRACKSAEVALETNKSPLGAVQAAITVLENDKITNAGRGSNLNTEGRVECDASVMDGDGTFGSIAAAPGIKNPIAAAVGLALESKQPLSHGRVRPIMLAGDAARQWAVDQGLETAATDNHAAAMLITDSAKRQHKRYLEILQDSSSSDPETAAKKQRSVDETNVLYDTVGCVVVDSQGNVAAGVSSGGIALKYPGRVGEAAVYGAGCWAETSSSSSKKSVAVSVTGVGERIMQHLVARESGKALLLGANNEPIEKVLGNLLKSTVAQGPPPRECGVLGLVVEKDSTNDRINVELSAVHYASATMAVAWLTENSGGKRQSDSLILRRKKDSDDNDDECQWMTVGVSL